jgi:hypothetical protein
VDWTLFQTGEPMGRIPPWATHAIFVANMNNFIGDFYIDDVEISEY